MPSKTKRHPYSLVTPCEKCPFRSDIEPFITTGRAEEILRGEGEFYCHKSVAYSDEDEVDPFADDDEEEFADTSNALVCAGVLICREHDDSPSQSMRIAERIRYYDPSKMRMDAPVYRGVEAALAAHRKHWSKKGKANMATTLKEKLIGLLESMVDALKPRDKSNAGSYLFEIWVWQEMCALAEAKLKVAWKRAQDDGIIADDDTLRATLGETIVVESDKFSCVATVASPSSRFDQPTFIQKVAKKWKLNAADLNKVADQSKLPSKSALTKRVLAA